MRKNRKRSAKMSVAAERTARFASVIMMLFIMVIINYLATSRCDRIMASIGEKEKVLMALEKDRERASGAWDRVKTDENLDRILPKLGMSMKYAKPEQVVYMDSNGVPERGQVSVRLAERRRASAMPVANLTVKGRRKAARSRR